MTLETCNTYLDAMATLNNGSNHVSDFFIASIDPNWPIEKAVFAFLDQEYGEKTIYGQFQVPIKRKINFEFKLIESEGEWQIILKSIAKRWFFEDFCSPKVSHEIAQEGVLNTFLNHVEAVTGLPKMYEISMHIDLIPMPFWEGYVFSSEQGRWILQFGWTD
jgi:hypothetical protein